MCLHNVIKCHSDGKGQFHVNFIVINSCEVKVNQLGLNWELVSNLPSFRFG